MSDEHGTGLAEIAAGINLWQTTNVEAFQGAIVGLVSSEPNGGLGKEAGADEQWVVPLSSPVEVQPSGGEGAVPGAYAIDSGAIAGNRGRFHRT